MTREEEIKQAAKIRADQYEHPVDWNHCYQHYIQGAEWADQHPKKGLWDGDRVIAWLKENIGEYYMTGEFEEYFDSMYEDLKKEMED